MSHREKSLTPWITNDPESYKVPLEIRTVTDAFLALPEYDSFVGFGPHNPVYLPKSLYDRAAALGYDMSMYAITRPMPVACGPGDLYVNGKLVGTNAILKIVPDSVTRRGNPK